MQTLRYLTLALIAVTPLLPLRLFLYRRLFGFRIAQSAKIGMFNLLDVKKLQMAEHSQIRGIGNVFLNLHELEIQEYGRIGGPRVGGNLVRGTANKKSYPKTKLTLGKCSIIELFNYFDLCADISIGSNVVIGGLRSVFFTHTMFKENFEPISIADNVYIGSNCSFQMGTSIAADTVVGMGAVITKQIMEEDCFVAGVPAAIVKRNYGYDAKGAYQLRKLVYFDNNTFLSPSN